MKKIESIRILREKMIDQLSSTGGTKYTLVKLLWDDVKRCHLNNYRHWDCMTVEFNLETKKIEQQFMTYPNQFG